MFKLLPAGYNVNVQPSTYILLVCLNGCLFVYELSVGCGFKFRFCNFQLASKNITQKPDKTFKNASILFEFRSYEVDLQESFCGK